MPAVQPIGTFVLRFERPNRSSGEKIIEMGSHSHNLKAFLAFQRIVPDDAIWSCKLPLDHPARKDPDGR